mmetsp:Transcript_7331/g.21666  ORF Transcript_7331/g.21666 Transcript_7331/m.21666 type:complete len:304 (+) Transcript_7331:109-1020(+)
MTLMDDAGGRSTGVLTPDSGSRTAASTASSVATVTPPSRRLSMPGRPSASAVAFAYARTRSANERNQGCTGSTPLRVALSAASEKSGTPSLSCWPAGSLAHSSATARSDAKSTTLPALASVALECAKPAARSTSWRATCCSRGSAMRSTSRSPRAAAFMARPRSSAAMRSFGPSAPSCACMMRAACTRATSTSVKKACFALVSLGACSSTGRPSASERQKTGTTASIVEMSASDISAASGSLDLPLPNQPPRAPRARRGAALVAVMQRMAEIAASCIAENAEADARVLLMRGGESYVRRRMGS